MYCDCCSQIDLAVRYTCRSCESYDLCGNCYASPPQDILSHKSEHLFDLVQVPVNDAGAIMSLGNDEDHIGLKPVFVLKCKRTDLTRVFINILQVIYKVSFSLAL